MQPTAAQLQTTGGKAVEGAWYGGQRYMGGQLLAPGQDQAGHQVSNEVISQTNPNNVSYVQQQQQQFNSLNDVQAHLNGVQNNTFSNYQAPDAPKVQSSDEILASLKGSGLLPTGTAPTPPNLVQTYQTLASQAGIDKIQSDITSLKAQQDEIAAQALINKRAEQGKPVAENVIQGRITQEQQQSQDQYDFIGRQLSRKVDELTSATTNIKAIMDFTETDYQNASKSYADQFSQAISTINLIHGIQQDQKSDIQKAQDNAKANAQIYVNAITAGNIDIKNLPADQQANLNKLEVQAGLPIGFFQSLKKDPKADIVSTSEANGQIQVLMRNPDGSMSLQKYGTGTGGAGTTKDLNTKAVQVLKSNANSYGDVTPQVWQTVQSAYIQDGGTADEFVKEFGGFADTNRSDFENAYGFKKTGS